MRGMHKMRLLLLVMLAAVLALPSCSHTEGEYVAPSGQEEAVSSPDEDKGSAEDEAVEVTDETDEYGNRIAGRFDETRFPLLAMIKSEGIYLYGAHGTTGYPGMILFQDDYGTYFNWHCLSGNSAYPRLSYLDYDKDGKEELAVIIRAGSGTEVSKDDLHVLEVTRSEKGDYSYIDHALLADDIDEWFFKEISARYSEDGKSIIATFDGVDYICKGDIDELGALGKIRYGNIVRIWYEDNGEITVSIAIGTGVEAFVITHFIGDVRAKVAFDGEGLYLTDIEFVPTPPK